MEFFARLWNRVAGPENTTFAGGAQSAENSKQAGLADAIRPQHPQQLAGLQLEVQRPKERPVAAYASDSASFKHVDKPVARTWGKC